MGLGLDIVYAAAAAVTCPVWGWKMWRSGKWRTDWSARFGFIELPRPYRTDRARPRTLLVHAVSVGEVNAVRGLVEELKRRTAADPWRIVISTTTDTGIARAAALFGREHTVVRFPFDFTGAMRRFVEAVQPDLVALVELEVWPNFIERCNGRAIPVVVVNGRLSERSFRGYRKVRRFLHYSFRSLAAVGAQTEAYAQRFRGLGARASRVGVLDTMKWDNAAAGLSGTAEELARAGAGGPSHPSPIDGAEQLALELGIDRTRPLIVAGSTGPGEERLLCQSCPEGVQLLIAPRKPERFDAAAKAMAGLGPLVRRTQTRRREPQPAGDRHGQEATYSPEPPLPEQRAEIGDQRPSPPSSLSPRFFLLDTLGELRKAYALADVCLVGRSFLGMHGSDVMEPIGLGKPTVIGPHHSDFAGMVEALVQGEGLIVSGEPMKAATELLGDRERARKLAENGVRVILSRRGATARYAELLMRYMPTKPAGA